MALGIDELCIQEIQGQEKGKCGDSILSGYYTRYYTNYINPKWHSLQKKEAMKESLAHFRFTIQNSVDFRTAFPEISHRIS